MSQIKYFWVDDEIDLLNPYLVFRKKNYHVTTCNNGQTLSICSKKIILTLFLDENMPGLSGLETLSELKEKKSSVQ